MAPSFKDLCSEADMRRFALCFLHTKDMTHSVDWGAAAADYDSNVKPESFKTVTTKAINRVKKTAAGSAGITEGDEGTPKAKGKGKGGAKKRKAAEDGENDGEGGGETTPAKKKKTKAKKAAEQAEDGEPDIKDEGGDLI